TGTVTGTQNITQWNSVNIGSPSNYGTGPGAVAVMGVNAFVTNPVAVTNTGTFVVQATLAAGSAVIGHVITDSGSTTAVTGTVVVTATLNAETTKVIGTVN